MITIINKSDDQEPKEYFKGTCEKCATEVICERNDIFKHYTDIFSAGEPYIVCPKCLEDIIDVDPISKKEYDMLNKKLGNNKFTIDKVAIVFLIMAFVMFIIALITNYF